MRRNEIFNKGINIALFVLIVFVVNFTFGFAQEVEYKNNAVYFNVQPYASQNVNLIKDSTLRKTICDSAIMINFTGRAYDDFIQVPNIIVASDPAGIGDVVMPPGLVSGWDMEAVYFFYKSFGDTMFVGFDFGGKNHPNVICGDADGNGNPGTTAPWLAASGGEDLPNLSQTEAVILLIDTNNDGHAEVAIGVHDSTGIEGFGVYERMPFLYFIAPEESLFLKKKINNIEAKYHANPDQNKPDLEFFVTPFSKLPGFTFTPGQGFKFGLRAYAGSDQDWGIDEDYIPQAASDTIEVIYDFGDAPDDSNSTDGYPTLLKSNGARHFINEKLRFGTLIDEDTDGQPNSDATGDDNNGIDDEDGVVNGNSIKIVVGDFPKIELEIFNDTEKMVYISGWIDFNIRNGWETSERAIDSFNVSGSKRVTLSFKQQVPFVSENTTYARFRISNALDCIKEPTGFAPNGEVEDYLVIIEKHYDFGDAKDSPYPTLLSQNGARHLQITNQNNVRIGSTVDIEPDGLATNDANGDDTTGIDDEDAFPSNRIKLMEGTSPPLNIPVLNNSGSRAILNGWIDYNGNGVWESNEQATARVPSGAASAMLNFPQVPPGSPVSTYARFRISTDSLSIAVPTGEAPDGEVEDYLVEIVKPARLGDKVWEDMNYNGIQELNEPGIANVAVRLLDGQGIPISGQVTTTNANGIYSFENLYPGEYIVEFVKPSAYKFTLPNQGADDTKDSDADRTTGQTAPITLSSGETNNTIDAGLYRTASIGDFVWQDLNGNGIQDTGEPGVNSVTVKLLEAGTFNLIKTTLSNSAGNYNFSDLYPGNYLVEFVKPSGYKFTLPNQGSDDAKDSDANQTTGRTTTITLTSGETDNTIDAGLYRTASIGDFVWEDMNGNGVQDTGEPGINRVTVNLFEAVNLTFIKTTQTIGGGRYSFADLDPGAYIVEFIKPSGYKFTLKDQGANDTKDSDADQSTGRTITITLASGESNNTIDAGLYRTGSIGDFVWEDVNGNGIQDTGEPGINNVTVKLLEAGTLAVLRTTLSNGGGNYIFNNLDPGNYIIEFVKPSGYKFTLKDQGTDDAIDSDANQTTGRTTPIALTSGETNNTIDAGLYRTASIGDFVWEDINGNGIQDTGEPGINRVTVNLFEAVNLTLVKTTQSIGGGRYLFADLDPSAYILEFVKSSGYQYTLKDQGANDARDSDADQATGRTNIITLTSGETNSTIDAGFYRTASIGDFVWQDLNSNGIQDTGESGINNVTVKLLEAGTFTVVMTTLSNGSGNYIFSNLDPGNYIVEFVKPSGYKFSLKDQGSDDARDSDADQSTGRTTTIALTSGETNNTIDAGLYRTGSIGDFVWEDVNGNGVQDTGESGINGATVKLLEAGTFVVVKTTLSNGGGNYSFSDIDPGNYIIEFIKPSGYKFTLKDQGGDDTKDSDADQSTGRTTTITLTFGETDNTIDAGFYRTGSIGDFVWEDMNGNGIQDTGEPGINNVTVRLLEAGAFTLIKTTLSNSAGNYSFSDLDPGDYVVEFVKPSGYKFTLTNQGTDDTRDSDADQTTGRTSTINLISGEIDNTIDAGFYRTASIGDMVWEDMNGNGLQDTGEPWITGVTVNLLEAGSLNLVKTTLSNSSGNYRFSDLDPGIYIVEFVRPSGYKFTFPNQGVDDTRDSDADQSTGRTNTITLTSGEIDNTIDAGFYKTASIGDWVWDDSNGNGVQDTGEPGIDSLTIKLLEGGTLNIVKTTLSNGGGIYRFSDLDPGNYVVEFVKPSGYKFTLPNQGTDDTKDSDADQTTGRTTIITLISGKIGNTIDAGLYKTASIGDFVWEDLNGNGIQDTGEPGINGVTVKLLETGTFTIVKTTLTICGGNYIFSDLEPDDYIVEFVKPLEYKFTLPNQGTDDTKDSDADQTTGRTTTITLISGETDNTIDAGLYKTASVGDFVWDDLNGNGVQDTSEPGIDSVTINLLEAGTLTVVKTTLSNNAGNYGFSDPDPGDYIVEFVKPSGYKVTLKDQGVDDTKDSDAGQTTGRTTPITLTSGETDNTIDAGFYRTASIGDFVWEDSNGNGVQDIGEVGIDSVTVKLLEAGTFNLLKTTLSNNAGNYSFIDINPGDYVVEFVKPSGYKVTLSNRGADDTRDSDADQSTGRSTTITLISGEIDNTIDAGFYRTASIGDFLWEDANGNGIQETGEPGINRITVNLLEPVNFTVVKTILTIGGGNYSFSDLDPGDYIVEFVKPSGYKLTLPNQGSDDTNDSDADQTTGRTTTVTLISGEIDNTIDAGFYRTASIGDWVWEDLNGNGLQDAGEPGINRVTVRLLEAVDLNVVKTTLTLSGGKYSFNDLDPGDYIVEFVNPSGYRFTLINQGADSVDSDADQTTGQTAIITLAFGDTNTTIDAGLYRSAFIGDFVWEDLNNNNIQDTGEPGIDSVTINLLEAERLNIVKTTLTSSDGRYNFSGLIPGEYIVEFISPTGYKFTQKDQGPDSLDSDADPNTGRTGIVTLNSGDIDNNIDCGLFWIIQKIDIEKYTNGVDADSPTGPLVPIGSRIEWKYVIKNTGNVTLHDIQLSDDQLGNLRCTNNTLVSGDSMIITENGIATKGQYVNLGTVRAKDPINIEVTDSDSSHYMGIEYDFGDVPEDSSHLYYYPTLFSSNGARHQCKPGFFLGDTIDFESDGQIDSGAEGDDKNGIDDEDGVILDTLVQGQTAHLTVIASDSGKLNAWIDFNCDGDWNDADEQIFKDHSLKTDSNYLPFTVPTNAKATPKTFARFRFNSNGDLSFDGPADDGEVEDYMVQIGYGYDFGDAPDPFNDQPGIYHTHLAYDGAYHQIDTTLYLGNLIDADVDGQSTTNKEALGDDGTLVDDEDGLAQDTLRLEMCDHPFIPVKVHNSTGKKAYVIGWIDCDGQYGWTDSEKATTIAESVGDTTVFLYFGKIRSFWKDTTFARIRISTVLDSIDRSWGFAPDGEVEDYLVIITRPIDPANLASFEAIAENGQVAINWITQNEPFNEQFLIYRSQNDSTDFIKINQELIPAQGDSLSGASYQFIDQPEQIGTYYYKLESVSPDSYGVFYGPIAVNLMTTVKDEPLIPKEYSLSQNYPNPFNPETLVKFAIPKNGQVTIEIYDVLGRLVKTLVDEHKPAGYYQVIWDARNDDGFLASNGIYLLRMKSGTFIKTMKMTLIK